MKFSIFYKNTKSPPAQAGFTLVELIVVMTIATILLASVIVQQNQWNDSLAVNSQAYELALMVRQAQVYSLGVREDTAGSGSNKFAVGYGIYFDSDNTRYIFFADRDNGSGEGNKRYDSGEGIGDPIKFTRGVTIKNVCGISGGSPKCIGGSFQQANILFFRPDPKANILLCNSGGVKKADPPVTISLQSAGGKVYSVTVQANGQVSISKTP
jgi:prepilin-type N-terminal cleavage/methylation domain-containing protein